MFDEDLIRRLHSGCSLVVGTVDADGRPHASRAWAITVTDPVGGRVRILVEADDSVTMANLRPGRQVAVTSTDVPTLVSAQLKGRVVKVEPATVEDLAWRRRYTEDFLCDIERTDGNPRSVLDPWADRRVAACDVDVDAGFDQTPGPAAGQVLAGPG